MDNPAPKVVVFAGPNGSGKSTLTNQLRHEANFPPYYVNADEIAQCFQQNKPDISTEERDGKAFWRGRALRRFYRCRRVSFAFETVFSHPSNLRDLELFRKAGYRIELNWVTTADPDINVARVCSRSDAGGHFVAPEKVRKRYGRSMQFLPRAVELADRVFVYDNSGRDMALCFDQEGGTGIIDPNTPKYLEEVLVGPLRQRQLERESLKARLGDGVQPAWPTNGRRKYEGKIVSSGKLFVVQQCADEELILHDFCVLPPGTHVGELAEEAVVSLDYGEWYKRA